MLLIGSFDPFNGIMLYIGDYSPKGVDAQCLAISIEYEMYCSDCGTCYREYKNNGLNIGCYGNWLYISY